MNTRTRVFLTTEIFLPELPGGLRQFFRYAPGLADRGVDLEVHTKRRPGLPAPLPGDCPGVSVVEHPLPEGLSHHAERACLLDFAIAAAREAARKGETVCLQPNGMSWGVLRKIWRARLAGVPSLFYFTMFPDPPPAAALAAAKYRVRIAALVSAFSRLVVCSHEMGTAYRRIAKVSERRVTVLPNGVDLHAFAPANAPGQKERLRRELGLPTDRPIVLYSGSVTPRKGTDLLLEAWENAVTSDGGKGPLLVLLGSKGLRSTFRDPGLQAEFGAFEAALRPRLERALASGSVIAPGEVENPAAYYRCADVFAFPSRREGLPNAVLEAMACGLPCVLSPFAGIPDDGGAFGRHGTHHIRSSHDPGTFANDLEAMLRSPEKRETIGAAARKLMEETQELGHAVDTLTEIYRSIAR